MSWCVINGCSPGKRSATGFNAKPFGLIPKTKEWIKTGQSFLFFSTDMTVALWAVGDACDVFTKLKSPMP
jgi:hypothetical protein